LNSLSLMKVGASAEIGEAIGGRHCYLPQLKVHNVTQEMKRL
jgi:hypothetical protein